jgi:CDP-diacylglycerol--serine O-phosphatidyltransferase
MKYFRLFRIADIVSMISLLFALRSIYWIYEGSAKLSILYFLIAFLFDLLDGYAARKFQLGGELGRTIDSIVDFFTYCVFGAYFLVRFLNPHPVFGYICAGTMLVFGALRLMRFAREGVLEDAGGLYYRGVTVVHVALIVVLTYLIPIVRTGIPLQFMQIVIFIFSVGMLSGYKSRKISSGILACGIAVIYGIVLLSV